MNRYFLTPVEISRQLEAVGEKKASAPLLDLLLSGVLAGAYIGFGAQASLAVSSGGTLDAGLARLLAGSVFSVGLMLVLIPGAELFTGNVLMTIGVIDRRFGAGRLLRNWLAVYAGNFVGAVLLALLVANSGLCGTGGVFSPVGETAVQVAVMKTAMPFGQALCRGILCNMLVCLAVIMCISSTTVSGKILGIFFPIMVFVLCGYEHSIANMYFLPLGLFVQGNFLSGFGQMWNNLIPVTVGNILGGLFLVIFHPKMVKRMLQ